MTGLYVPPADFYEQMQQPDTIVIDAQNTYEFDVSHIEGAIRPENYWGILTYGKDPIAIGQHMIFWNNKGFAKYIALPIPPLLSVRNILMAL